MKHFTIKLLAAMPVNLENRVAKPFPGKWPTRMAWVFQAERNGGGPTFTVRYLGKPNCEQARRLHKLLTRFSPRHNRIFMMAWEFDRENILMSNEYFSDREQPQRVRKGLLWDAYHPWTQLGNGLQHLENKLFLKNIGGFLCYANVAKLKVEYITAYKQWMLKNMGKQLQSAEERKAAAAARREERIAGLLQRRDPAPAIDPAAVQMAGFGGQVVHRVAPMGALLPANAQNIRRNGLQWEWEEPYGPPGDRE